MTTDALKALFVLLESDDDDFAMLVHRFGIDPATDLQNCDLTNVDFGNLTADTLNLTGSILDGVNLSNVRCKRIVGVDDTAIAPSAVTTKRRSGPPAISLPLLDTAVLAVSRYQNAEWITRKVVESYNDSATPILAFYDTTAEQDFLTKQLCSIFTVHDPEHRLSERPMFLWFYSKAHKPGFELTAPFLERSFFELLRTDKTSDDIGVYPYLSNRAAVTRIRESLAGTSYDRMRKMFAQQLGRELARQALGEERAGVALFSGYPPTSKRLYQDLRGINNRQLKLIFLCSSQFEKFYEDQATEWKRLVVPADAIGRPTVAYNDIGRLAKRIETVSRGTILLGLEFQKWLADHFIGKPLTALRNEIIDRLKRVSENLPANELTINEIVL
jgi:hypothetical protein